MSSSKYPERWIVPGGGVEQDETNAQTAVREILEEAGVVGRLGRCLGVFEVSWVCVAAVIDPHWILLYIVEWGAQTPNRGVCINSDRGARRVGRLENDRPKAPMVHHHRSTRKTSSTQTQSTPLLTAIEVLSVDDVKCPRSSCACLSIQPKRGTPPNSPENPFLISLITSKKTTQKQF